MKRHKWQQDRDRKHAEARVDLVNAMDEYPDHVVKFILADYLRRLTHEDSSAAFEAEDDA